MSQIDLEDLLKRQDESFHELLTSGTREDLVAMLLYFYSEYKSALHKFLERDREDNTIN